LTVKIELFCVNRNFLIAHIYCKGGGELLSHDERKTPKKWQKADIFSLKQAKNG